MSGGAAGGGTDSALPPGFARIDDPDDPRIAPYRAIREKDLVGRMEGFIAEGAVVLKVLLTRARFQPQSFLIGENRVEALSRIFEECAFPDGKPVPTSPGLAFPSARPRAGRSGRPPGAGERKRTRREGNPSAACPDGKPAPTFPGHAPVFVASKPVLDEIAGFHLHRGLLAHGLRGPLPDWRDLLPAPGKRARIVVLMGLANHDNVGGVFRNAAAFGADAVLLDPVSCDPLYRKAIRVSVGGSLTVPFARFEDPAALVDGLRAASIEPLALALNGSETLAGLTPPERAAIVLGAEGPGLPKDVVARMTGVHSDGSRLRQPERGHHLRHRAASPLRLSGRAGRESRVRTGPRAPGGPAQPTAIRGYPAYGVAPRVARGDRITPPLPGPPTKTHRMSRAPRAGDLSALRPAAGPAAGTHGWGAVPAASFPGRNPGRKTASALCLALLSIHRKP
ncbi:TrmH family RNA methyltransferase [Amorphus coralli]|uniref:TrmH family RNA methyltransferase n=1 Tax=Amorphus coralli TaxID=340680 RepID=UPI0003F8CD4A|nr:RNA methyltransferase [Amorphus coralli]